jgi:hypothetical protein
LLLNPRYLIGARKRTGQRAIGTLPYEVGEEFIVITDRLS